MNNLRIDTNEREHHYDNRRKYRHNELRNLEQQREELVERNAEIQRRIEIAQSEETIREYALSQGMIQG